ncbi:MAG: glycoside hydrolase, partial [Chloroflexota bacterium]|nr:glycoside hydrolase [Chloroflexota bacterium]
MRVIKRRAGAATVSVLALAAISSAIAPTVAQAAPGPRFGDNFRLISADTPGRGPDTPGLAADPSDPNHIVEVDSNPVTLECDFHASFDGGRTWSGGHLRVRNSGEDPPLPTSPCDQNYDSGGYHHFDTGVVFGSGQNVYATVSSHRGPFNRPENGLTGDGGDGDDAIVARSTDGGRTFQPAVVAIPGGGPVLPNQRGLAGRGMRPQLAVQRGAGSGGQDRLYVASWNCFIKIRASQTARGGCSGGGGDRRIFVARSDDGGANWNAPALASAANVRSGGAEAEAASPDEQAREPSQPVVGPDGAVYVAYNSRDITDGTTCPVNPFITTPAPGGFSRTKAQCTVVARSTNQGQSWQQFSTNVPLPGNLPSSHPRLAIDPSRGGAQGTLYIGYQRAAGSDPADILLQSSTDGAQTWSNPVKVNDDTGTASQTNAWPSVGSGGRVDVTWADRRHPYPGSNMLDVYFASSANGGASFGPNRRVTDRSINTGVGRFGDYGSYTWYGPNT